VYYLWHKEVQRHWRLSDNPFQSAHEYLKKQGADASLEILEDVVGVPGTESLAFQVTDLMREWSSHTQELALDSTCECSSIPLYIVIFMGAREH